MDKDELVKNLCGKFCSYYKPAKDPGLACNGFLVAERLIKSGKKLLFEPTGRSIEKTGSPGLLQVLCEPCAFYAHDCDFAEGKADAEPCGGFILLGNLLHADVIVIDDIGNMH